MWQRNDKDTIHCAQVLKGLSLTSFSYSELGQHLIHLEAFTLNWTCSLLPERTCFDLRPADLEKIDLIILTYINPRRHGGNHNFTGRIDHLLNPSPKQQLSNHSSHHKAQQSYQVLDFSTFCCVHWDSSKSDSLHTEFGEWCNFSRLSNTKNTRAEV